MIASLLTHQVYKKGQPATELFPYLQPGVPDFLEDERVSKARKILNSTINMPDKLRESNLKTFITAIKEEIQIEGDLDDPDYYVIRQLKKLIA
ncbi:hypothetical protein PE36_00050 [Moritella sp. PE36]|uniref:hypothetical protein n=1 Tax=Moritella sp. PE36 TaxID=58051 RepID=UPI0001569146|nr:hypothetical protein [Moritella sp. PE36]EDM66141.1 hypothetical protein PE36_00050 [Moritella sp. PE36]